MSYPFNKIEHRIYKNTFLQNTLVSFHFESIRKKRPREEILEDFKNFVQQIFKIDIEKDLGFLEEGVRLFSHDKSIVLVFHHDHVDIKIGRTSYISFEQSVLPYLNVAKEFLDKVVQSEDIDYFNIRKINIWPIEKFSDTTLVDVILKKILSPNLLSGDTFHPQCEPDTNVTQWEKERLFDWEEYTVKLKYGFKVVDNKTEKNLIILDSLIENKVPMKWEDLNFLKCNQILFDAYHWSVSDDVIEIMKKELE